MTNPLITIVDESEDLVLLAPGSSMDQHHPHMEGIAQTCHRVGLCTWRFQFDYRTEGKAFPPRDLSVTINEYEQAFEAASKVFPDHRIHLGGHSYGARVATHLAAHLLDQAHPLRARIGSTICFSVPVHPANKPSLSRWKHASRLTLPVCFISGERDPLAYGDNLVELFSQLSTPSKQLSIIPGADHGFRQPKTIKVSHEAFSVAGEALTSFLASLD
jgi:predicted alpha/beta-hydrolase family hydrolase